MSDMSSFDKAWNLVKDVKYSEGGMHTCPTCEGRGETTYFADYGDGEGRQYNAMKCHTCNGTGQVPFSTLASRAEEKENQCNCPEFNDMAHDRHGSLVPASEEQIQDWQEGVLPLEDGRYICSTCNGEVPMSG